MSKKILVRKEEGHIRQLFQFNDSSVWLSVNITSLFFSREKNHRKRIMLCWFSTLNQVRTTTSSSWLVIEESKKQWRLSLVIHSRRDWVRGHELFSRVIIITSRRTEIQHFGFSQKACDTTRHNSKTKMKDKQKYALHPFVVQRNAHWWSIKTSREQKDVKVKDTFWRHFRFNNNCYLWMFFWSEDVVFTFCIWETIIYNLNLSLRYS